MTLLETYANSVGVKIPIAPLLPYTSFYPLPFEKYITFHPSSGMPAKNYDYYFEVLIDILPVLKAQGYEIVQLGDSKDKYFDGCYDLRGKTNIAQAAFVVKNSKLHLGNDSVWMHVAGLFGVYVVALFGPTYANVCGPYYKAGEFLIESDRNGQRASHNPNEIPKTINLIKPEQVSNAVFVGLGFSDIISRKTIYIGKDYCDFKINYIPSELSLHKEFKDCVFELRADLCNNPQVIGAALNTLKCNIHISQVNTFDFATLSNRKNINSVIYHVESVRAINMKVVKFLASNFNYTILFEGDDFNDAKLYLMDYNLEQKEKLEKPENLTKGLMFKSTELFYSEGKIFLSKWHLDRNIYQNTIENNIGVIPDDADDSFWNSVNNFLIYQNI